MKLPEYYVEDKLPHSFSRHPTLKAIIKYKNHPSIRIIKSISKCFSSFYFSQVDKSTVLKEIRKLNMNKAVQDTDIPVKILKEKNAEYFAEYLCLQFNEAICASKFPATFKFANLIPIFKQSSRNQKKTYKQTARKGRIPFISKIFEKLICRQLSNHFDDILSKFQCSFRKGYSLQHCLLLMIYKW